LRCLRYITTFAVYMTAWMTQSSIASVVTVPSRVCRWRTTRHGRPWRDPPSWPSSGGSRRHWRRTVTAGSGLAATGQRRLTTAPTWRSSPWFAAAAGWLDWWCVTVSPPPPSLSSPPKVQLSRCTVVTRFHRPIDDLICIMHAFSACDHKTTHTFSCSTFGALAIANLSLPWS